MQTERAGILFLLADDGNDSVRFRPDQPLSGENPVRFRPDQPFSGEGRVRMSPEYPIKGSDSVRIRPKQTTQFKRYDYVKRKTLEKIDRRCREHFRNIYGEEQVEACMNRLARLKAKYELSPAEPIEHYRLWNHRDQVLITYADMVRCPARETGSWLQKQHRLLREKLKGVISTIHLLPFFPSSSDDGFSVIDYRRVDEKVGRWEDIEEMSKDFRIMGDLVINHVSRHSEWFRRYLEGDKPWADYFIEVERDVDLSDVTRPRSSPLLTAVQTKNGKKLVWSTFSDDQIDVNFANPDVLFEYLDIFFFYLSKGIRVIRLDAVAFLWKEIGTSCIHLPQTHEVVRLLRTLVNRYRPDVTLITETNVPHKENISYFGQSDETHMVYQFSLPPLLLHALLTENASYLTQWADSIGRPPMGCTYLNFTASHDGIGLRPLEGLVPDKEFSDLVQGIRERGGYVSYRRKPNGTMSPYELNITWFDAFATLNGHEDLQIRRYFCTQILMLSLRGVPGIYFHNLTGTKNYREGVRLTGRHRSINRRKWDDHELRRLLADENSKTRKIFERYREILRIRSDHPAFDPYGRQEVYDVGREWFVLERGEHADRERVLVVANVTLESRTADLAEMGLPVDPDRDYVNLLDGRKAVRGGRAEVGPCEVLWIPIRNDLQP